MLSLTLVALSRGQTLWLETDMQGASAEGACKRYAAPGAAAIRHAVSASVATLGTTTLPRTPRLTRVPCSFVPQMRDSPPQHHLSSQATLASCVPPPTRSAGGEREMGLRGWFGACYTVIKWDCLGERRRRRWSIMFCRAFHCSIVAFLFLSGQTLMLYPLTFVVPAAMFHKHRMGNILSIRNLDCRFPPATLHSTRAQSHSPSPTAEALSFPSPMPLIHLNILQSAPFIRRVMYNLRQQQCQHGSMFFSPLLVLKYSAATVLFQDNCTCRKKLTCLKLRRCQVFNLALVFMIESVLLISS